MVTNPGTLGKTHLLAYLHDSDSAAHIRALMHRGNISDFIVEPGGVQEATEFLRTHASPRILIVEIPSAEAAPALLDALADVVHPSTRVIVTGTIDALSFYNWLIGLGIHDYLLAPFTEAQLAASLDKLKPPAATHDTGAVTSNEKRHTIAVIGARGGVGATTVATTLAAIGARDLGIATALVDLDLHFGTSALALDLEAGRSARDALEKPDRVDTLFLERLMLRPFQGLALLSCEEPLAESIAAAGNAGEHLLATLHETYALVVADLPRHLDTTTRQVLSHSDTVLIVAEPTIASLRDALRLRDYCADTLKRKHAVIIVNREGLNAKQEIPKGEFNRHLGADPALRLHYIPEIMPATAQGVLVLDEPKAASFTAPLRAYLQALLGKEAADGKAPKGIASLFKGKK